MSRKPLSEMAHKPGKMSEESEYILHEMKTAISVLEQKIERCITAAELSPIIAALEKTVSKADFMDLVRDYDTRVVSAISTGELVSTINLVSNKLQKVKASVEGLASKLDTEDVTNLDQDYRASVDNDLSGA